MESSEDVARAGTGEGRAPEGAGAGRAPEGPGVGAGAGAGVGAGERRKGPMAPPSRAAAVYGAVAVAVIVLLALWQGRAYVDYADGVYVDSAEQWLHHVGLYRQMAGAQPPGLYLLGRLLLGVGDSIWTIRIALGAVLVLQGGLVALSVWRLTRRRNVAVLTGLASLLTPWTLREHTALIPETLGSPLLLGAAIAAARSRRGAAAAGALGALAAFVKLSFALAALAIVVTARRRRAALAVFALAAGALAASTLMVFGARAVIDNTVVAQLQIGTHTLRYTLQLWVQAAWNEGPLLLAAVPAVLYRARTRDAALLRTLLALTLTAALLLLTLVKKGSYLEPAILIEAPAITLAAAGLCWWTQGATTTISQRLAALLGVAALALTGLQAGSMLLSPTAPLLFARPASSSSLGWAQDDAAVRAGVRAAHACPPGTPYGGAPYLAYLSARAMPGLQPDQFIIGARVNARFVRAVRSARTACPASQAPPPG